jgi:hypothetical protein
MLHQSNAGIKGGYLAAVRFDGSGETGQHNGFHIGVYGESFIGKLFYPTNYCILNKATKLKMLMVRLQN